MNPIVAYLLGPELVWLLMYAVTSFLTARNQPPTEAGNQQLELIGWFLPTIGVLLSCVTLAWAPGSKWLWLLRIIITGCIGIFIVTGYLCGGIDYHDSRNSGVGTAYIVFIGMGLMALAAGAVVAAVFFVTKMAVFAVSAMVADRACRICGDVRFYKLAGFFREVGLACGVRRYFCTG